MRSWIGVAAFSVFLTVACTGARSTGASSPTRSKPILPSTVTPTPTVSATPSSSPHQAGHGSKVPKGTERDVLKLPSVPMAIVVGDGALFTIVRTHNGSAMPVRFDPPATATRGVPISLDGRVPTMLAFAGGVPWVAAPGGPLARLDAGSLAAGSALHVTPPIIAIAGTTDRLWVATAHVIYSIDPFSGATLLTIPEKALIRRFAVSPDGSRVYLATARPIQNDQVPVIELDASTGTMLARTWGGVADLGGVSGLTATPAGVWIAEATGMMGNATFARSSDLRQRTAQVGARHGPVVGTNAIRVWFAGGFLWSPTPDGAIDCIDPSDGLRNGVIFGSGGSSIGAYGGVVSIGNRVWTGAWRSIDRIKPPNICK